MKNYNFFEGKKAAKYSTQRNSSAFEYTQAYINEQIEKRRSYSSPKTNYDPSPPLPSRYSAYEKGQSKGFLQSTNFVPNSFKYMRKISKMFHEHIFTVNVLGDGHCGFYVITKTMGIELGEDDWGQFRKDLQNEIEIFPFYYVDILRELQGYDFIHNSFIWEDVIHMPPPHKWMRFPETGYIIASRYNIVVVMIHSGQGLTTYLPMHSSPPTNPDMIIMAYVNTKHYVEIIIDQRKKNIRPFPMPTSISGWEKHHSPEADQWKEVSRIFFRYYEALRRRARSANYSDPINVTDKQ